MKTLKIAMIGAGNIACTHLKAYQKIKQAEVVALCDIDPVRLEMTANKFGFDAAHCYTDVDQMLAAEKELDAADVCVWNVNHATCSIAALRAGLHVICEKPMAYSAAEAQEMKREAQKAGKLLMIGFVLRFSSENAVVKDLIDAGTMGELYYSKATYLRRHGNPGGWFSNKALSGGGPVIDLGVHVIDQTRYLMGSPKPVSVYAMISHKLGDRKNLKNGVEWRPYGASDDDVCDVEDFGTALIRYDNGAVTLLETSYDFNGESASKKELYGTKGGILLGGSKPKLFTDIEGYLADVELSLVGLKGVGNGFDDMFVGELSHFVDCALNGTPCIATAEDGIVVMKILDAIYESARLGREVLIK
ncbi:MAG: Gfo/Idh/MocA family oxidoreductase [Ruminococcaceae bacterium]|nr:Gfo/Idh/MocA family oxidoreductase [Oscillospiraceae bacterium]